MQEPIPSNEWKNKMKEWVKEQLKTYNYEQIKQSLIGYGYNPVIAVEIVEEIKYEINPFELLKEQIEKMKTEQETDRNICYADTERLKDSIENVRKEIYSTSRVLIAQINSAFEEAHKTYLKNFRFRKKEAIKLEVI